MVRQLGWAPTFLRYWALLGFLRPMNHPTGPRMRSEGSCPFFHLSITNSARALLCVRHSSDGALLWTRDSSGAMAASEAAGEADAPHSEFQACPESGAQRGRSAAMQLHTAMGALLLRPGHVGTQARDVGYMGQRQEPGARGRQASPGDFPAI